MTETSFEFNEATADQLQEEMRFLRHTESAFHGCQGITTYALNVLRSHAMAGEQRWNAVQHAGAEK